MASIFRADSLYVPNSSTSIDVSTLISNIGGSPYTDWAAKSGPTSLVSAYRNAWTNSYGSNKSITHNETNSSFRINAEGYYEISLSQRTSGSNGYVCLALNGSRSDLENRVEGIWTHSDSAVSGSFTYSHYIGFLFANEIITGGGLSTTGLSYGANGYIGSFKIVRIG